MDVEGAGLESRAKRRVGIDAPADAIARFENPGREALRPGAMRGMKPRRPRADDGDIDVGGRLRARTCIQQEWRGDRPGEELAAIGHGIHVSP